MSLPPPFSLSLGPVSSGQGAGAKAATAFPPTAPFRGCCLAASRVPSHPSHPPRTNSRRWPLSPSHVGVVNLIFYLGWNVFFKS